MDVNSDPGCCRAIDPDMAVGSSLGPDNTMAPGGSRPPRLAWSQLQRGSQIPTRAQAVAQTLGFHVVFVGNMGHVPQLW